MEKSKTKRVCRVRQTARRGGCLGVVRWPSRGCARGAGMAGEGSGRGSVVSGSGRVTKGTSSKASVAPQRAFKTGAGLGGFGAAWARLALRWQGGRCSSEEPLGSAE